MPEFQSLDAVHQQVHRLAQRIVSEHQDDASTAAAADLAELLQLRDRLIEQLQSLAKAVGARRG